MLNMVIGPINWAKKINRNKSAAQQRSHGGRSKCAVNAMEVLILSSLVNAT